MSATMTQHPTVSFASVDRENIMTLHGVFQLLQEIAIAHANLFDTGTDAMMERGESWLLSRMAVAVERYPRYEEKLQVHTWSSGIRGFKGFRDFHVTDAAGATVILGSSLWVYFNTRTLTIMRVPADVAARFPSKPDGVFCPGLERLEFDGPGEGARTFPLSLRYSDIDANDHVNNTAYMDLLQTALVRAGLPARPTQIRLKYAKPIPAGVDAVEVRIGTAATAAKPTPFSIGYSDILCAVGTVA